MFRAILSFAFAAFLFSIVKGFFVPKGVDVNLAMWDVAMVGVAALLYSSVNGFNAVRHSLSETPRVVYMGLVFSFLPLLVAVYALAVWQYAQLSTFQVIAILFGAVAAIVDIVLFSWLSFGRVQAVVASGHRRSSSFIERRVTWINPPRPAPICRTRCWNWDGARKTRRRPSRWPRPVTKMMR